MFSLKCFCAGVSLVDTKLIESPSWSKMCQTQRVSSQNKKDLHYSNQNCVTMFPKRGWFSVYTDGRAHPQVCLKIYSYHIPCFLSSLWQRLSFVWSVHLSKSNIWFHKEEAFTVELYKHTHTHTNTHTRHKRQP